MIRIPYLILVCEVDEWKGDGACDDGNNNGGCDFDGGDCCGSNVNDKYCKICQCKERSGQSILGDTFLNSSPYSSLQTVHTDAQKDRHK